MHPAYDVERTAVTGDADGRSPVDLLHRARRAPDRVRLEGVHAFKHAARFGARIEAVVGPDLRSARELLAALAPDVALPAEAREVDAGTWAALTGGRELPSPLLASAHRPVTDAAQVLASPGRVVVLDDPRHLGNLGAVVRVAAAAGAGGVLVVGEADPWHPTAVRAAAGLQFALRTARCDELPPTGRDVLGLDGAGAPLTGGLPADAVLVVGTERHGIGPQLRARVGTSVAIGMRPGVSSLNLATAVAVALYAR